MSSRSRSSLQKTATTRRASGRSIIYGNPGQIGTGGIDDPASWQEFYNPVGRDKTAVELDVIRFTGKKDGGLGSAMAFPDNKAGRDEEHTDGKVATQAIELLDGHETFKSLMGTLRPIHMGLLYALPAVLLLMPASCAENWGSHRHHQVRCREHHHFAFASLTGWHSNSNSTVADRPGDAATMGVFFTQEPDHL